MALQLGTSDDVAMQCSMHQCQSGELTAAAAAAAAS